MLENLMHFQINILLKTSTPLTLNGFIDLEDGIQNITFITIELFVKLLMHFLMATKKEMVYPITKTLLCPRCRQRGKHTLYVPEYAIYKCTICGNIHA